jgi:hypothetical protein
MLRGMLPSAVCGPMTMKRLGTVHHDAREGFEAAPPSLLEPLAAGAADVDAVEAAGDGVEAGGEDDEVEGELALRRPEAGRRDALDGCVQDADQLDVGLVVDLVVAALLRHPARAESALAMGRWRATVRAATEIP